MINEHFRKDIHSLNPISPECLECGEVNISIASMMALCMCLGLGRVRVTQPKVRARWGKSQNTPRIDVSLRDLCDKGRHLHLKS